MGVVFLQFLGFPPEVVGIFVDMLDGELGYLSEFGVLAVVTKNGFIMVMETK